MLIRLRTALRALLRRSQAESELDEELRYHIEQQTEQNIRLGMDPEEARIAARKAFGGVEQAKERSRDARGARWIEDLWQDLRFGARLLMKKPGFTIVAVLTLALGIGANTVLFSLVNIIVFRPWPYRNPERMANVFETSVGANRGGLSPAKFLWLKERGRSFDGVAASLRRNFYLVRSEGTEMALGYRVSANLFDVLGARPALGRTFLPGEDRPGAERVVVLSYRFWRRLSGDPNLIGQKLMLQDELRTVIGVMPPDFYFQSRHTDVFVPFQFSLEDFHSPNSQRIQVTARLKPGVTLRQADAEMSDIAGRLEEEFPTGIKEPGMRAVTLTERSRLGYLPILWALQGAAGCVLLIACANLANLLLVRANTRSREFAIRAALGAGWRRIIRQSLTESILLAAMGGLLGLLLTAWSLDLVYATLPESLEYSLPLPEMERLSIDHRVLWFAFGISLLAGLISGLAPALNSARRDLNAALKDSALSGGATLGGQKLTRLLVVGEIALSLMLLVGAGLLLKSYAGLLRADMGFDIDHIYTAPIELSSQRYPEVAQRLAALREVVERTRSLPGVISAALCDKGFPVESENASGSAFTIEGHPEPSVGTEPRAEIYSVGPDYFGAVGIPLLKGRKFTEADTINSQPVVIVSESFARRFWPGEDSLGKSIRLRTGQSNTGVATIVGVSGAVRNPLASSIRSTIYYPMQQSQATGGFLILRASVDMASLVEAVRKEIRALDPNRPVLAMSSYEQSFAYAIDYPRFSATLLGFFAGLALPLAMLGIYGVMRYWVEQRVYEIGVRMALGAQSRDALKLVIGQGIRLTIAGVALGVGGALAMTRLLKTQLYGVSATDPLTFVGIALLLTFVTLLACWIPARRATKVDPLVALRRH
jgi:putative ABC transport system permease protein